MYKKLMFLISLVVLLGLAVGARAADIEVAWGETLTISGPCTVEDFEVEGHLVITATGNLTVTGDEEESQIDGSGVADGNMEGATVTIDGGTLTMNARLNIGTDHDGYLIINNGGIFTQTGTGENGEEGVKFPDNEGGEHRIIINDGTFQAYCVEQKNDRDAKFELGLNGQLFVEWTTEPGEDPGEDDYDPWKWEENGDLTCTGGCIGPFIEDWGDNGARAYCMALPDEAWGPTPADGAVEQVVTVDLEWNAGAGAARHMIYFGTDSTAVFNAGTTDDEFQGLKNAGQEKWDLDVDSSPAIILELWKTYYWRIDEFTPPNPNPIKGNVWSFTCGCSLVPGDINLDCVVNLLDYAMLADDWRDESMFPSDVP